MKKRSLGIFATAFLAAATLFGAISGSIAWFNSYAALPQDKFEGSLRGAYFAYGDGSAEHPYGINIPRHLYNLAWLQYTGYFNRDNDNDGTLDTFYFEMDPELTTPLDMTGYTLPPIGTERYPFLGKFNGNSKIITNLHVSNSFNSFGANHPTTITNASAFVQPQIVGLFGVVGSLPDQTYKYNSDTNKIYDLGVTNCNVATVTSQSLIGVVAGYVNGDISGVAVDASEANISAENTTSLKYTSNLSDHGVVGYVAKASMKNEITRVDETIYNLNISSVHEFNAADKGDDQGFGGSIDMKTLYNDIATEVWEECTNNTLGTSDDKHVAQYPTTATQAYDEEGNGGEIVFDTQSLSSSTGTSGFTINGDEHGYFTSNKTSMRRYYNYDIQDAGKKTSSFGLIVETGNAKGIDDEKSYMCLSGERDITADNGATLTTSYYVSATGSFIYYVDGSGTRNYLNYNSSTSSPENVTATDDKSCTASLWTFSNGAISTIDLGSSTNSNTVRRYLNCTSANTLTITATSSSTWTKDSNGYYVTLSGTKYYLGFDGTKWTTTIYRSSAETKSYYRIHSGNNYMTHADPVTATANVNNTSSPTAPTSNNVRWYWKSGNYFSATEDGTMYYLCGNGNNVRYQNSTTNRYAASAQSGDNITLTYSEGWLWTTTYYVGYNNNVWTNGTNSAKVSIDKVDYVLPAGFEADINSPLIKMSAETTHHSDQKTRTSTIDSYVHTNPTYIPLMSKKLTNTTHQFGVPDPYNTGYIVSGAKYMGDPYGDIRVSSFPLTSGDNSLSGSSYDTSTGVVGTYYTVNDSGTQQAINKATASDVFKNTTRQLEENILFDKSTSTNAGNVYGLHFMDAPISFGSPENSSVAKYRTNNVGQSAYIEKAQLNNEEQPRLNYEVPTDCIDFHLKEKGYINFVAGTYYQASGSDSKTRNTSFFALYQVIRNNDSSIKELREISEIYATTDASMSEVYSYQYKYDKSYTDNQGNAGQWSVPFKFSNGTKVKLDGSTYYEDSVQSSQYTGFSSNFKTSWIKGHKDSSGYSQLLYQAAYFFEIPMNVGEYCLGSVPGYNGAYLMYLDIGANAAKTYRTVVSEHFKSSEMTMEYPLGIAILSTPTSITSTMKTKGEEHLELACVSISKNYSGTVRIARDASNVGLINISGNSPGLAVPNFQGDSVELNIAAQLVPKASTQKDIKRIQYYDYGVNTQETTRVMITFTSTDGGSYEREIKCYDAKGSEITDQSQWRIYRTKNGVKFAQLSDITYANLTGTGTEGLYYTEVGTADNNILLKARYWEDDVTGESAYILTLTARTDANGKQTFVYNNYKLEVTATGGSLVVKVLAKGSKSVYIGNTPITEVGQKVTIGA